MTARPRITVAGSTNVDLVTFTDRFPRPGETTFENEFHLLFGGKGANQAVRSPGTEDHFGTDAYRMPPQSPSVVTIS